jgi:hypothetical protein
MHAFLICGQNQNIVEEEAENLLLSRSGKIAPENRIDLFPSAKKESKMPTLTIEDVRFISNWLSQQSPESRAVIVHNAQCMTIPAQQAFLKTLEEPFPDSSRLTINDSRLTIVLTSDSETSLLPTILSRCKIIRIKESGIMNQESGENEILPKLIRTSTQSPTERILNLYAMLSEFSGKKFSPNQQGSVPRPDALKFMENIIDGLHSSLIHKSLFINHKSITICLQSACLSHRRLKNNLNVQLALQQFFLDIPPVSR